MAAVNPTGRKTRAEGSRAGENGIDSKSDLQTLAFLIGEE